MQVKSMMRQTYGRTVAIAGHHARLASELTSEPDIQVDLAVNNKAVIKASPKISFMDKVMYGLEKEDTIAEQLVGYGICALAVFYLMGSLLRAVLHMV